MTNIACRRVQQLWLFGTWSDLSDKPRSCSKPAPCPTSSASCNSNSPSCSSSKKRQLHSLLLRDHPPPSYHLLLNLRRNAIDTSGSNDVYDHTLLSYNTIPYDTTYSNTTIHRYSRYCLGMPEQPSLLGCMLYLYTASTHTCTITAPVAESHISFRFGSFEDEDSRTPKAMLGGHFAWASFCVTLVSLSYCFASCRDLFMSFFFLAGDDVG